jgi:hypothetical protein
MKEYRVFRYVMMNMVKKPLYAKANSKLEKPTLYVKYKGKMITYKSFMKKTQATPIIIVEKGGNNDVYTAHDIFHVYRTSKIERELIDEPKKYTPYMSKQKYTDEYPKIVLYLNINGVYTPLYTKVGDTPSDKPTLYLKHNGKIMTYEQFKRSLPTYSPFRNDKPIFIMNSPDRSIYNALFAIVSYNSRNKHDKHKKK